MRNKRGKTLHPLFSIDFTFKIAFQFVLTLQFVIKSKTFFLQSLSASHHCVINVKARVKCQKVNQHLNKF